MNRFCYVAKPHEFESPKGLLIRTALYNGYDTVHNLCKDFNVTPFSKDSVLLCQDSVLLKILVNECPEYASSITGIFYSSPAIGKSGTMEKRISFLPYGIQNFFCYCPDCLLQENLCVFQDLKGFPVCPIHNKKIIHKCPNCGYREKWTNANLHQCRCGFLRKTAPSDVMVITESVLDIFEGYHSLATMRLLNRMVNQCERLWSERKNQDSSTPFELRRKLHQYVIDMITEQLLRYPGFSLNMHLAPWAERVGGNLYDIAHDFILDRFSPLPPCDPGECCSAVTLTAKEFHLCIKERCYSNRKKLLDKNLIKGPLQNGKIQLYTSRTPICKLIKTIDSANLLMERDTSLDNSDLITTTEAAFCLHCTNSTVIWLADQGFLIKGHTNKIRGQGHKTTITKISVTDFSRNYILVGEMSSILNIGPREVVSVIKKIQIRPVHSRRGPYVFERKNTERMLDFLQAEVRKRHTQLEHLDETSIHDSMKEKSTSDCTKNQHTSKRERGTLFNQYCDLCKGIHFKKNQLSRILNISPQLIQHRFFLSGLIHFHTTEHGSFVSRQDIDYMVDHLEKYVSIPQATRLIKCSQVTLHHLLNFYDIKPSLKLKYPSGEIDSLFFRKDIEALKNRLE